MGEAIEAGSELFLKYVVPDSSHDGINIRVWRGTPWIVSTFTGSQATDPSRRYAILEWCHEHFGDPALPFGPTPRAGRWREGNATVFGWTWFGFSTEAELREFEGVWGQPTAADPQQEAHDA